MLIDYYLIPESVEQEILPSSNLSITALTSFLLPSQHRNIRPFKHHPDNLFQYFSKDVPSILSERLTVQLRNLPTPENTVIQKLLAFKSQAHLAGFQSVRYGHLQCTEDTTDPPKTDDLLFPLWTVTFWSRAVDVKQIAIRWMKCRDWITVQLQQKKSPDHRQLAEEASIAYRGRRKSPVACQMGRIPFTHFGAT